MPDARPRLRDGVTVVPHAGAFAAWDAGRLVPGALTLGKPAARAAGLLDGSRTADEVARAANVDPAGVNDLVRALDAALLLDGGAFADYLAGPDRFPCCVGVYPPDPAAVPAALERLFTAPGGPGLPGADPAAPPGRLRAVLAPHMDYGRGGVTYGHAFKDLVEQTDARLFVVVATSHYSAARFSLTRKHYRTPLGVVETDLAYVDRIADGYGVGAFADPLAHLPEHSVELELPFLQHFVAAPGRPVRVVPLLVGSFADCIWDGVMPEAHPDIARMVAALRAAEAAAGEPVCYVVSGDLAHVGPKFRDRYPVTDRVLADSRAKDEAILEHLERADSAGYFLEIAAEGDRRRVCGLPPTWLALAVTRPRAGAVRHYQQYADPTGHESVSFAAASFYD